MPTLHIIQATTPDTLAQVHHIRHQVFVLEQQVPATLEYEHEEESQHYLLYADGQPAATARWRYSSPGKAKIERIAVLPRYRGQGLGDAVVRHLLAQLPPAQVVYMHAQSYAAPFYEQLGFVAIGPHFDEAGIDHVRMELRR